MQLSKSKKTAVFSRYIILTLVGIIMLYPLLWMIGATFKTNSEMFTNMWFWPKNPVFEGYKNAFVNYGGKINLLKSLLNTYSIVLPKVTFTIVSTVLTAYGFGRFDFCFKRILFAVMLSTLFLPQVVLNAPQYIMFNSWGWTNSYLPLIVPSLFATDTFFVFMIIQFLRSIPCELDESARIDGCNPLQTLIHILVPLLKPSIISCALFQFMWSSNDFMGPLIYISNVEKYTNSIFLRLSMDGDVGFQWNRVLAMSFLSIIPMLIVFFSAQKYFVDGISAGSIKG